MDTKEFEKYVENIIKAEVAAGIAVAVINREGDTLYQNFFGYRDIKNKLPINEDTIFGMASVTKSFVALSVMQLFEKGKLDLSDSVSKYIPEFTNKNQDTVKICHLLNHTAGYYPLKRTQLKDVAKEYGFCEKEHGDLGLIPELAKIGTELVAKQMDAQTKDGFIIGAPGNYFSYCNDGFGLLSEIVCRVSGERTFADYIQKNVLTPLSMTRSACEYVKPRDDSNSTVLYTQKDGRLTECDYYNMGFVLAGAGALKSTLCDMKKAVLMYLNYGNGVLSADGIKKMCTPTIECGINTRYCMGLKQKKHASYTVIEHNGSQPGVSSNIAWSYDTGLGVVVLCNTENISAAAISEAAMRMATDTEPDTVCYTEWNEKLQTELCGEYCTNEVIYKNEVITKEDGKLLFNGKPVLPINEDTAIVGKSHIKLFFDSGEVFALRYGMRMLKKVR